MLNLNQILTSSSSNSNYKIVKKLGYGTFGRVYKVEHLTQENNDEFSALKLIQNGDPRKEIEILKKLNHPNIVKYKDDFYINGIFGYCILIEFCNKGDLNKLIQSFLKQENDNYLTDKIRLEWSLEMFDAVSYMHSENIVHRDLNTKNIFLHEYNNKIFTKIGDVGLSREIDFTLDSGVGTLGYMSPQILNRESYTKKTDVWSLGCVIYEMITLKKLKPTFRGQNGANKSIKLHYESIELEPFINKMLMRSEKDRSSSLEIFEDLKKLKESKLSIEFVKNQRSILQNNILKYIFDLREIISKYDISNIYTMEEITVSYDELGFENFTFLKNYTFIPYRNNMSDKNVFTVLLTIGADGILSRSMCIFMKTFDYVEQSTQLYIEFNEHGGLNKNVNIMMNMYGLEIFKTKWIYTTLIIDESLFPLDENQKTNWENQYASKIIYLPNGPYKNLLHPIDASLFEQKSIKEIFKDVLLNEWKNWRENNSNKSDGLSHDDLIKIITKACENLKTKTELFKKSFESCGFLFNNEELKDIHKWNPCLFEIFTMDNQIDPQFYNKIKEFQ